MHSPWDGVRLPDTLAQVRVPGGPARLRRLFPPRPDAAAAPLAGEARHGRDRQRGGDVREVLGHDVAEEVHARLPQAPFGERPYVARADAVRCS